MKNRIKEIREYKGITQKELAQKIGVTRQAISSMENSDSLTQATLIKISNALDTPLYYLIFEDFELPQNVENETKSNQQHKMLQDRLYEQIDRYYKDLETADTAYIKKLSVPALKLNDLGRKLLFDNAEALAANEELTKGQENGEQAQEEK